MAQNRSTEQITGTKDEIIRCIAMDGTVRVTIISGKELVAEARRIHALSRVATAALGRQLMMTAIMALGLKNEGDLVSTIIKGNGEAGSMICTGDAALNVKGSITNGQSELPPTSAGKLDVGGFVGHTGKLTVVSDLGLREPYVGICNLVSGEIAEDFAQYYAASMQQPALVYLGVRVDAETGDVLSAGGALVEPMPGCLDETIDRLQAKSGSIATLAKQIEDGVSPWAFVESVFGDMGAELMERRVAVYACDCSRERVMRALVSAGESELTAMIEEDHGANVTCRFCETAYDFTEQELKDLLAFSKNGGRNDS